MVEIHLSTHHEDNRVIVDGKDITNYTTKVKVEKTPKTIPVVELQLIPDELAITGDAYFIRDKSLKEYDNEELIKELIERKQVLKPENITVNISNPDDKEIQKMIKNMEKAVKNI